MLVFLLVFLMLKSAFTSDYNELTLEKSNEQAAGVAGGDTIKSENSRKHNSGSGQPFYRRLPAARLQARSQESSFRYRVAKEKESEFEIAGDVDWDAYCDFVTDPVIDTALVLLTGEIFLVTRGHFWQIDQMLGKDPFGLDDRYRLIYNGTGDWLEKFTPQPNYTLVANLACKCMPLNYFCIKMHLKCFKCMNL